LVFFSALRRVCGSSVTATSWKLILQHAWLPAYRGTFESRLYADWQLDKNDYASIQSLSQVWNLTLTLISPNQSTESCVFSNVMSVQLDNYTLLYRESKRWHTWRHNEYPPQIKMVEIPSSARRLQHLLLRRLRGNGACLLNNWSDYYFHLLCFHVREAGSNLGISTHTGAPQCDVLAYGKLKKRCEPPSFTYIPPFSL